MGPLRYIDEKIPSNILSSALRATYNACPKMYAIFFRRVLFDAAAAAATALLLV